MADMEYTVKVSGIEDVERLEKNLDNLHRTLNAGSGAGKSLEEMRKILVGMRGQASIIADLRDSVKSLNSAAENLGKGFESGFSRLDKTLKQGFQLTLDRVNMLGAEMSKGLSSGVKGAFDAGTQAAAAGGKKLVAQVNTEAKAVSAAASKYTELENKVRASVRTAMNMPSGNYQTYNPSSGLGGQIKELDRLKEAQKNAAAAADPLRKALKGLTIDGNDTHSAMRGLASGFNLLWLTWGNLAPLFAGAAISNGFMQTAKQGMEVAHTLQTIATLGENSAQDMKSLTAELINLGNNGPYGPLQIAEAMKILSLAGLNAKEVLATTGTVMNFATSGTTDLKTAADVLVSVTTAFGTGAAGFERSADIITRAAADSKASVESFGEAMKTASVVGEQYKVTQEDLALNIQLLAQVGIEGTSAGTAVRNMYADITGRSGQVSKILRSLGLDFKNLDGSVVTTVKQMEMLYGVLKNYDAKSVGNILQAIYGERGAKAAIAALQAYKKEATDPKFANALVEQYEKIKNAAADSAIAAAFMGESSKKSFEAAAATLQTTMFSAFQNMEGELYLTALAFKKAFGDPETKALLEGMTSAVAQLGRLIAENLVPLANIAIAWGTYRAAVFAATTTLSGFLKVAGAVSPVMPAMGAALSGLTSMFGLSAGAANGAAKSTAVASSAIVGYSANITNGMASAAKSTAASSSAISGSIRGIASVAGSMAGNVLRALPVIGNVLSVAAIGWTLYKSAVDDARASSDDFTGVRSENIIKKLNEEAKALNEVTRKRREGMSQTQAETELLYEKELAQTRADVSAELPKAKREYERLLAQFNDMSKTAYERGQAMLPMTLAGNKLRELETREQRLLDAQKNRKDAARAEQEQNLAEAKRQQEEMEKLFANGSKSWSLLDFQESQKDSFAKAGVMRDNELEAIKSHFDSQLKAAKEFYDAEKKLLDQRNSANLISEQEYLASSMTLAIQHQTDQLAVLDKMQQEYDAASNARIEKLQARQAAAKGKAAEALVNAIRKEQQAAEISNNAFDVKRAEIAAEAYGRVGEVLNKVQTDLGKLIQSNKEFWDNRALEQEAVKAATAIDDKYRNMNTSIMSMDVAMYEFEKAQHAALVQSNKQNDALRRQLVIQKDLVMLMKSALEARIAAGSSTIEEVAAYKDAIWTLEDGVNKLETQLTESTAKGLEDGAKAGMDAFAKARKEQFDKIATELSNAITQGLMSGDYKSIGRSIWSILQEELLRKPLQAHIKAVTTGALNTAFGGASAGGGLDLMSVGKGLWDLWSGSTAGTVAAGVSGLGTLTGSVFLGELGAAIAAGVELGISGAAALTGSASATTTAGMWFGAAMPWLAGIGALLSIIPSFLNGGTPHAGAASMYSGGEIAGSGKEYTKRVGVTETYQKEMQAPVDALAMAIGGSLDALAKQFGGTAGYTVQVGFKSDNDDPSVGQFRVKDANGKILREWEAYQRGELGARATGELYDKDPAKGFDNYLQSITAATIPIVQDLVPSWADDMLDSFSESIGIADALKNGDKNPWKQMTVGGQEAFEALQKLIAEISAIEAVFKSLNETIVGFADASDKVKGDLLKGLGGIEGLVPALSTYYENFYSEQERYLKSLEQMNTVLDGLGVDIDPADGDAAKAAFRKAIEDALRSGNGELAAALIKISGQFAEIADAAQDAAESLKDAAKTLRDDLLAGLLSALESSIEKITSEISEKISALEDSIAKHEQIAEMLASAVKDLRGSVASTSQWESARAMVYIEDVLEKVRAGADIEGFIELSDAVSAAVAGVKSGAYVSQFERDRDALVLAGQLEELGDLNDVQLSVEERQLKALKDQLEYYERLYQSATELVNGVDKLADNSLTPEELYAILTKAVIDTSKLGMGDAAYDDYTRRDILSKTDRTYKDQQDRIRDIAKSFEGSGDTKGLWEAIKAAGGNEYDLNALYGWSIEDLRKVIAGIEAPPKKPSEGAVFGPGTPTSSPMNAAQSDYNSRSSSAVLGGDAAKTQMDIRNAAKQYEGSGDVKGLWDSVTASGGNQYDLAALYGWNVNDIEKVLKDTGVPGFSQGINVVPHDMLAQVHEGEAIIPKRYNPFNPEASGGFGGNSELVSEIRSLHQTIHELKVEVAQLKSAAAATAKNTAGVPQLVDQFDEVTEGGNVLRAEVVNA